MNCRKQRRIVAKVDQLMASADALETQHAASPLPGTNCSPPSSLSWAAIRRVDPFTSGPFLERLEQRPARTIQMVSELMFLPIKWKD